MGIEIGTEVVALVPSTELADQVNQVLHSRRERIARQLFNAYLGKPVDAPINQTVFERSSAVFLDQADAVIWMIAPQAWARLSPLAKRLAQAADRLDRLDHVASVADDGVTVARIKRAVAAGKGRKRGESVP